jgi:methylisocitrate lyase
MSKRLTPGEKFRQAVANNKPLQLVGTINALTAHMAKEAGHQAIYLAGSGVAANSLGLPDLGISTIDDVLTDVRRITDVCDLPMMVDADTGFGGAFNIARTIRSLSKFGAAGCHIEDQVAEKRCGHRPGKEIVSQKEMVDRIKSAVDARIDDSFVIMARTDALAVEGIESAIDRANACLEAGADMIFPEAMTQLDQYKQFRSAVDAPILANITEFGQTPLFTTPELSEVGVDIVLYCCGAYRAMNRGAETFYKALINEGHQKDVVDIMQTREELYSYLNYHQFEQKLNSLFASNKEK